MASEQRASPIVKCDECGREVAKRLVGTEGGPTIALACDCHVLQRTQGIYKPFSADLPEKWWAE